MKADEIASLLNVTWIERTELKLTTIGCIDVPKAERDQRRKERHRLAQKNRRRRQGARPRDQYLKASISRRQPWVSAGVSRATWYRRRS